MKRLMAPSAAPTQLWWTDLDEDAGEPAAGAAVLSEPERARAARFIHERHRRRYTAAHAALRRLLSQHTGRPASELMFVDGPFGKPALIGPDPGDGLRCAFNMSHCENLAVFAVAPEGEIGVDVELLRPMDDADALARHHFTANEQAAFNAAAPAQRTLSFLYGWTRKEACLKAIGCGLAVEPHSFEVGLSPGSREVKVQAPHGAVVVDVESVVDGARAVISWARLRPGHCSS
ncbi:4'-phosphopantetheinyl transferase family protein [Rhizobacter sp. LjRoot28]|jgi:4'-phosphopantetheinyl transferase|uniref:4'-phosphopantetheinyl transferase family protein n=1 Tax=Rhizobacter sp. LjRoot28 TaxID=3342309 RepID=UPI003ED097F2